MEKVKLYICGGIILAIILGGFLLRLEISGGFTPDLPKEMSILRGNSFGEITKELKAKKIISNRGLFTRYAKMKAKEQLAYIRDGVISFEGRAEYAEVLDKLLDPNKPTNDIMVTIPEGYELREIADLLEKNGYIDKDVFYDAVANHDFGYDFLKDIPSRENRLEGFLFPDTYQFSKETDTEITIIEKMLRRFNAIYNDYKQYEKELDMTTYEIVTLASIIEREAMYNSDFKNVSSVFHNRLGRNDYLRYLQSCATVQYILKERKPVLSISDTKIDSPYNTYTVPYLPQGPISSPGKAALEAAVMPNTTDYLFFLNDSQGRLHFSTTYEEHMRLAEQYVNSQ